MKNSASYPSLTNKTVVITGGATGIGAAMALAFSEQGANVVILDQLNDEAHKLADAIGAEHEYMHCDVAQPEKLEETFKLIYQKYGSIDVLIANAANDKRHKIEDVDKALWDELMDINLAHQFFSAKEVKKYFDKKKGGVIICMGSISWLNDTVEMPVYTTAKAAIHGLVRTLARLWGKDNIRVNGILPGWTMTEKQLSLHIDGEAMSLIQQAQCLSDNLQPADVAQLALFLAADDSRMITNQCFVIDGGWV